MWGLSWREVSGSWILAVSKFTTECTLNENIEHFEFRDVESWNWIHSSYLLNFCIIVPQLPSPLPSSPALIFHICSQLVTGCFQISVRKHDIIRSTLNPVARYSQISSSNSSILFLIARPPTAVVVPVTIMVIRIRITFNSNNIEGIRIIVVTY